jgi:hypothetical protein
MKQWKLSLKQKLMVPILLLSILLGFMLATISSAEEAKAETVGSIQGMDAEARAEIYSQSVWNTSNWQTGKTLSTAPYSVVAGYDVTTGEPMYRVRVWTGLLLRDDADLLTYWDELSIDADGKLLASTMDLDVMLKGYFLAASQSEYASKAYVGMLPWSIELPTDKEADLHGLQRLESGTMINWYGLPLEGQPDTARAQLNELEKAPSLVAQVDVPRDIQKHWAGLLTIELMQQGIIQGFEDQTIRPEDPLTRAQFISMLSRMLGAGELDASNGSSVFEDIQGHWAEREIIYAEQTGILDQAEQKLGAFRPNKLATRADMAGWVDRAMVSIRGKNVHTIRAAFHDISTLTSEQQAAISRLAELRILTGYEDGSFQPERTLKRAEAFAVLSRLLSIAAANEGGAHK